MSVTSWRPNVRISTTGGVSVTSGANITVDAPGAFQGDLAGTADSTSAASSVAVTQVSSSTAQKVPFVLSPTGTASIATSGLAYVSSTNVLSVPSLVGSLIGTAATADTATNAAQAQSIRTTASSTNSNLRVAFTSGSLGFTSVLNDAGVVYNPSTNVLDVGNRVTVGNYSVRASGNYLIDPGASDVSLVWSSTSNTGATFMSNGAISATIPYTGLYSIFVTTTSETYNGVFVEFGAVTLEGALRIVNSTYGTLSSSKQNWTGSRWNTSTNYTGYLPASSTIRIELSNVSSESINGSAVMHIRLIFSI